MLRIIVTLLSVFGPALVLCTCTGCEKKTVTVQQSEQRHESEPKMVSPGKEVVE